MKSPTSIERDFILQQDIFDISLIPRHFVIVGDSADSWGSVLKIWDMNSFEGLWEPGSVHKTIPRVPPLLVEPMHLKIPSTIRQRHLSISPDPLDADSCNIWVITTSAVPNFPGRPGVSTTSHFKIKCRQELPQQISLRAVVSNDLDRGLHAFAWCGIAYSGHLMLSLTPRRTETALVISPPDLSKHKNALEDLPASFPDALQISAYSGALVHLVGGNVVIDYYE